MDMDTLLFTVDFTNTPGELVCWDSDGNVNWRFDSYGLSGNIDLTSSVTLDTTRHRIYFGTRESGANHRMVAVDYTHNFMGLAELGYSHST